MSAKQYPSVEYLRQCFRCKQGKVFWLIRPRHHFPDDGHWKMWNKRFSGKEAGYSRRTKTRNGFDVRWFLKLDHMHLIRSNVVWAMHSGEWPVGFVDHKNRNPLDDSFDNLRLATPRQNSGNARRSKVNTSGFKGVFCEPNRASPKKWRAQIGLNYKHVFLGYFDTPEEAHTAYCEAATRIFGEFACDGKEAIR